MTFFTDPSVTPFSAENGREDTFGLYKAMQHPNLLSGKSSVAGDAIGTVGENDNGRLRLGRAIEL
jgi:hypothetical protein